MTADIEKLKALALAYLNENSGHWYGTFQIADGISYEPAANFIYECSPAAVLELIAEVERLRAEAARYRWLRDKSEPGICAFYLSVGQAFKGVKFTPETVDAALDDVIEKEKA